MNPETLRIPAPPHEQSTVSAVMPLQWGFEPAIANARATAVSGAVSRTAGQDQWNVFYVTQRGESVALRHTFVEEGWIGGTALVQEAPRELSLDKAAEVYTEAFAAAWGRPTWNEVTVTDWEDERTYRFTVTVTPEEYEDVEGRLERENQIHERVEKQAPDYAGFFAIRYKPTDDRA
jgi:hypothetical protein